MTNKLPQLNHSAQVSTSDFSRQLFHLLKKDFKVEFRQKVLSLTVLLFVVSATFAAYQVFFVARAKVNPLVWNAIFWLIISFSSFQVVGRSFVRELEHQFWYYFFLLPAGVLIGSKLIYHYLFLQVAALFTWFFLALFFRNPIQDNGLFLLNVQLASLGLSAGLTLISAISARAGSNAALLPVLGFPMVLPTLLLAIRISVVAIDGLGWEVAQRNIFTLLGFDAILLALSFLLFPYLWRR